MAADKPRFRFSLRTLFVAVTVCASACWVLLQLKWINDRHYVLKPQAKQFHTRGIRFSRVTIATGQTVTYNLTYNKGAPGSLGLFGEKGIDSIFTDGGEKHLQELKRLFPEARVEGEEELQRELKKLMRKSYATADSQNP